MKVDIPLLSNKNTPQNKHGSPENGPLEFRRFRTWKPSFPGSMLIFGGVDVPDRWTLDIAAIVCFSCGRITEAILESCAS